MTYDSPTDDGEQTIESDEPSIRELIDEMCEARGIDDYNVARRIGRGYLVESRHSHGNWIGVEITDHSVIVGDRRAAVERQIARLEHQLEK